MKANHIYYSILAVLFLSACQDMGEEVNHYINLEGEDVDKVTMFTAGTSDYSSRTVLTDKTDGSGKALLWSRGDKIRVSDGKTEAVYTTDADGKSVAEFVNVNAGISATATQYTAFYPETLSATTLILPAIQQYVKDGMDGFPMMAQSGNKQFTFRNLCGALCLRIKTSHDADIKVSKVILSSPDAGLSGKFTLDGYKAVITDSGTDLTLECGEGITLSDNAYTDFYLYLPDNKYGTMNLTLAGSDGSEIKLVSNGTVSIVRSSITKISVVLDTANYNGSFEDLPVIDDGTGFTSTTVHDSTDGVFSIIEDDVELTDR